MGLLEALFDGKDAVRPWDEVFKDNGGKFKIWRKKVKGGKKDEKILGSETGGPIKSVSVISTGTGEAHWEHIYGTRKPALWWIFFGRQSVTLPLNAYVIERSDGLVLFDTGQDRTGVTDPNYWPTGFTGIILRRLFRFHIGPDDTLTRQLEMLDYLVADVRKAVFSHLHCDHIGGIREIMHADLVVSRVMSQNSCKSRYGVRYLQGK